MTARTQTKNLGRLSYEDAKTFQLDFLEKRANGEIPDTLLFVEHPPVITLGKKSPEVKNMGEADIPKEIRGVPVHLVERGGEATFHGPGQLVAYPIFSLHSALGPKAFLRILEIAIQQTLAQFKIPSYLIEGKTGVWLRDEKDRERKIASLGIAVRKNVSYHGLALNVSTDLTYFSLIQPCGFAPTVMTSMEQILGHSVSLEEVSACLEAEIFRSFSAARNTL